MKAVFLYDFTGIMAQPWLDAGCTCYLFDGQHPKGVNNEKSRVTVGMWLENDRETLDKILEITGRDVCFVFGFPECTDLAVSGSRHFQRKLQVDPFCQIRAVERAKLVENLANEYGCPFGVENPVSVLSTMWRKPDFYFHPWEYGGYLPEDDVHPIYPSFIKARDAYPKKTGIWCGNGFVVPEKKPVEVPPSYSDQYKKLGGKSLKTKNIRSATPRGFAKAVFEANKGILELT